MLGLGDLIQFSSQTNDVGIIITISTREETCTSRLSSLSQIIQLESRGAGVFLLIQCFSSGAFIFASCQINLLKWNDEGQAENALTISINLSKLPTKMIVQIIAPGMSLPILYIFNLLCVDVISKLSCFNFYSLVSGEDEHIVMFIGQL